MPACLLSIPTYVSYDSQNTLYFSQFLEHNNSVDLIILCLETGMLDADEEPESKTKRAVMSLLEKVVVVDKFDRGVRIAAGILWCE
jgi:hypothetical protein